MLADGRVLANLSKLRKDNTGYDLKHLFMGSEGTLGIITAAVLKLYPSPRAVETAFIGLACPQTASHLLVLAQSMAGRRVKTFEFISRLGLDFVRQAFAQARAIRSKAAHDGMCCWNWPRNPRAASTTPDGAAGGRLRAGDRRGCGGGGLARPAQALSGPCAKICPKCRNLEGGSIKHDVCVPVAPVPAFLEEAIPVVEAAIPGARPVPFGHMGDGNIHFNVSQPIGADKDAFLARWEELNEAVHAVVTRMHGSISAEHGIGVLKRDLLPTVKDSVAMDVMRRFKTALDPHHTLNPGKVL